MTMDSPLSGLRVVEVGPGVAGALACRLLAGYGADVVKVEPPQGDPMRSEGPFPPGRAGPETSVSFLYFHGGKSSVVLSIDTVEGRSELQRLLDGADVLVLSLPPGERAGLGLDRASLALDGPGIVVSVSPFGESGPFADYAATDLVEFASGGQMSLMGDPDKPPLKSYGNQAECQAAFHVFGATLAAYLARGRDPVQQYVEISVQEIQASAMEAQGPMAYNGDELPPAFANRSGNGLRAFWAQYECKDGYAGIFVNPPNFPSLFAALGRPELLDLVREDPSYLDSQELAEEIRQWCLTRTRQEVYEAAILHGAPFSYVATPDDLLTSEPIESTGLWRSVDHPVAGAFRVPGSPIRSDSARFDLRPAPLLGEHTTEVLGSLRGGQPEGSRR